MSESGEVTFELGCLRWCKMLSERIRNSHLKRTSYVQKMKKKKTTWIVGYIVL